MWNQLENPPDYQYVRICSPANVSSVSQHFFQTNAYRELSQTLQ